MRAILTPCIQRELGIVMFRPGGELMPMFMAGRVLISNEPEFMKSLPAGAMANAEQELAQDPALQGFFNDERVISAAGHVDGLENWLSRRDGGCQWPHDENDNFHMSEMTFLRYDLGSVRLCWHHDHRLRGMDIDQMGELARRNLAEWILDAVRSAFMFPEHHQVTLPELCWWAAINNVIQAMPEGPARRVMKLPPVETPAGVMRDCDIEPIYSATSALEERAKPVLALAIDPEPPESFMLKPKRRRWVNEQYTRWVKSQQCAGCGQPADDPHHITGYGLGGMATKPHDWFTIPLCRRCHDELHRDARAFEAEHGSQLEMLVRVLDRALAIGVITTGKLKQGKTDA